MGSLQTVNLLEFAKKKLETRMLGRKKNNIISNSMALATTKKSRVKSQKLKEFCRPINFSIIQHTSANKDGHSTRQTSSHTNSIISPKSPLANQNSNCRKPSQIPHNPLDAPCARDPPSYCGRARKNTHRLSTLGVKAGDKFDRDLR